MYYSLKGRWGIKKKEKKIWRIDVPSAVYSIKWQTKLPWATVLNAIGTPIQNVDISILEGKLSTSLFFLRRLAKMEQWKLYKTGHLEIQILSIVSLGSATKSSVTYKIQIPLTHYR